MLDELNLALEVYEQKWHQLLEGRQNKEFFAGLKPTAVGWKVADRTEYDKRLAELHNQVDMIIEKWMNGRWIAKVHLKDDLLTGEIQIVKLMERRPGSTDAVGLDHVDFYAATKLPENEVVLTAEPGLKWSHEDNDILTGYEWLSVWFGDTEAKIKSDTILDIVGVELKQLNDKILSA